MDSAQTRVLEAESFQLSSKFQGYASRLVSGKIDLANFERLLLADLKEATIRAYVVGADGKPTARHYGSSGLHLRQKYADIHNFVEKIGRGELSEAQIRDRLNRQARTVQTAAARSERITRVLAGFDLAKRTLDPQSSHCQSCLRYATSKFVPVTEIVPRGVNCECGSNCRCIVFYKKSENPLNPLSLAEAVNIKDRELSSSELTAKIEKLVLGKRTQRPIKGKGFGTI